MVKKVKQSILRFLGLNFLSFLVNVLLKTVKIRIENFEAVKKLYDTDKNFIVAFWHGKMFAGWFLHKNKNFAALVSQSKDGEILSNLLSDWNYKLIRGSSNIGGKEALELLFKSVKNGNSIAVTPDGPTGPAKKMKPGAVVVAHKTNIPLVLLGLGFSNNIRFNSWDNFEVPLPFSGVTAIYSEPIMIDKNLSRDKISQKISECENKLNDLQKEAEKIAEAG